ncbi:HDIG domain-containing protein [Kutzneria viridogrisea]|uniref:HD domain-containing protein n=2 Tax=Kutzneria TaxID=43356 RepID=W5W7V6_9PSEU|nr:HD domain-containing protein [Kutzneria albida]AHH97022.1 hypothetical protein KALB_3658 [Kutzneria albida DSM 43870]MBA8932011.1 hypothetical protein [Kutzneria viridogrisea]
MVTGASFPYGVDRARELAHRLLARMDSRWRHTAGVAGRAEELALTVPIAERAVLVAAAWLHDIGYAEPLVLTGFHPLDGARYLDRQGWPPRISALVAHHSGARLIARELGVSELLNAYPQESSAVADALTCADQTVGHQGERLAIRERLAEVLRRHGPDSPHARVHAVRGPYLLEIAERVERRLAEVLVPAPGECTGWQGVDTGRNWT